MLTFALLGHLVPERDELINIKFWVYVLYIVLILYKE